MKKIADILDSLSLITLIGDKNTCFGAIAIDSRKVVPETMFVAVKGTQVDGHLFICKAIEQGAVCIVCEVLPAILNDNVVYIQVKDTAIALATIARNYYERPSEKLKVLGVTGTNGKTTVATILFKLFTELGYKCGLISTVQNQIGTTILPSTHTTPNAVAINVLLHEMWKNGCTHVFMECSSHAIHQHRIDGLCFAGAIFTNITHDHLDYHKTFAEYISVKKSFFDSLPSNAFAITNIDDKNGRLMVQNTVAKVLTYSLHTLADAKAKILENILSGLLLQIDGREVHFRLIGAFNAYNILAAYVAALAMGEDKDEILRILSMLTSAEGRFEYLRSKKENIIAIVDYAHTPDALENVLTTIQELKKSTKKIITVVGCGGDRDKEKRPVMASVAARLSDKVVLTSDNPRTESPEAIIQEMSAGLDAQGQRKTIAITDRREAIKLAVNFAHEGDIVLVAGKGHEKYQEINGVKTHFDDKEVLKEMFDLLDK